MEKKVIISYLRGAQVQMRKCRNWQTSKTKDLVIIAIVWVQVPSSACFENLGSLDFTGLPVFYVIIFDGTFGTNRTNLMKEPY